MPRSCDCPRHKSSRRCFSRNPSTPGRADSQGDASSRSHTISTATAPPAYSSNLHSAHTTGACFVLTNQSFSFFYIPLYICRSFQSTLANRPAPAAKPRLALLRTNQTAQRRHTRHCYERIKRRHRSFLGWVGEVSPYAPLLHALRFMHNSHE